MSSVNEQMVREYFEALGFFVLQPRKYQVPGRAKTPGEEIDLLILNPRLTEPRLPGRMVWTGRDFKGVVRAVVGVRGWHTERFSAATFLQAPDILRFADDEPVRAAGRLFGAGPAAKVLCLPQLPVSESLRGQALDALKARGIDGVLPFRTLLKELTARVDVNRNYEKSDVLQTIRILKAHDLLTPEPQLSLFARKPRAPRRRPPPATAAPEGGSATT